jgi:hypothetical protein
MRRDAELHSIATRRLEGRFHSGGAVESKAAMQRPSLVAIVRSNYSNSSADKISL